MDAAIAILAAQGVSVEGINLDDIGPNAYTPIQGISSKEATAQRLAEGGGVDDMIQLDDLDKDAILGNLKVRYDKDVIYTYIGSILVSVNCFKTIPGLYDNPKDFRGKNVAERPPHLYALSEKAFSALIAKAENQSFIISGESGAGKTESMKIVCRYITAIAGAKAQVQQAILNANVVIEAFGNAKTIHNNNSSRFGKWTELQMDRDGLLMGAVIRKFLLEKSRVVYQAPKERNFHCFYYLLAGTSDEEKIKLRLTGLEPSSLYYLKQSGSYTINGVDDKKQYIELLQNMTMFTPDEINDIKRLLAGILLIGQIEFREDKDQKTVSDVLDQKSVTQVCDVLEVDAEALRLALITNLRYIVGDISRSNATIDKAVENRDALAKACYDRMFSWLVSKMSQTMEINDAPHLIGILDIFGFENFQTNSFEQFCINLANEHLQQFFTEFIFAAEQAEYQAEDVPVDRVEFTDNTPCLELITAKNVGLLALLDEQTYFPQATELTLIEKMTTQHGKHANFGKAGPKERSSFKVIHYAGAVTYNATEFLNKNRDTLSLELTNIFITSKFDRLRIFFEDAVEDDKKATLSRVSMSGKSAMSLKRKTPTASSQFKDSLDRLMLTMQSTAPHFVRCIKPNPLQVPDNFQPDYVTMQLTYAGMLETVRIRRQGFPVRYRYEDFTKRFILLLPPKSRPGIEEITDKKEGARALIQALNAPEMDYCFGRSKLFLKDRVASLLETRLSHVQAERLRLLKEHVERLKAEAEEKRRREEEERRRAEEERLRREEEERLRIEEEQRLERLRIEEEHRLERLRLEELERRRQEERRRREEERRRKEEERIRQEEERMAREAEDRRKREEERRRRQEEEEKRWADIQDAAMSETLALRALKLKRQTIHLEMFEDVQRDNTMRRREREAARQQQREERNTMRKSEREEAIRALKEMSDKDAPVQTASRGILDASTFFKDMLPPQVKSK